MKDRPLSHSVSCSLIKDRPLSHSDSLTEWLSGLSFVNEQNECLWVQFALPPTSSGVDQVPYQRLIFPLYDPFSSSRACFYGDTLYFRPLVERSFAVVLSTYFPFDPRKIGKTTSVGIEPRSSFVRL